MNCFADNLREIRNNMGLSQKELSEITGISKAMIKNYEDGKNIPKGKSLEKLEKGLKIEIKKLFSKSYKTTKKEKKDKKFILNGVKATNHIEKHICDCCDNTNNIKKIQLIKNNQEKIIYLCPKHREQLLIKTERIL